MEINYVYDKRIKWCGQVNQEELNKCEKHIFVHRDTLWQSSELHAAWKKTKKPSAMQKRGVSQCWCTADLQTPVAMQPNFL